jgi:hypothetical protein
MERAIHIATQSLRSLQEAHDFGIVHRDLKPENVFLTRMSGEDDFVKILDFGIAKIMDQNDGTEEAEALTSAGVLVGTLRYMAPEQIAGGDIGPQSDLYALGLIGVEMLTGRSVFAGTGRWEVLHKQISDDPVDIPDSVHRTGMYEFFRRALSKNTDERFINADEMLKAIDALGSLAASPVAESDGKASAHTDSPISQSGPNSGLRQPVTNPRQDVQQVFESGSQVPVQVGAEAGDEATQFHALPSDQQAGPTPAAQSGAGMQMNAGQPQAQRQPMMTPIPRQGAAFQSAPPQHFGSNHAQANGSTTGSFEVADEGGNGKLMALAAILFLFIGGGAIAVGFMSGLFDGGDSAEAAVAGVDAGTVETTANAEAIAAATTAEVETTPNDTETIETKWVRLESGKVKADVFAGAELIGTTPVRFAVKEAQVLTVKAKGYEDQEVAVGPESDEVVPVELAALEVKEEPKEEAPEPDRKPPAKDKKPKDKKPKDDDGWLDVPTKPKDDDGWLDVPTKPKEDKKDDVPIF